MNKKWIVLSLALLFVLFISACKKSDALDAVDDTIINQEINGRTAGVFSFSVTARGSGSARFGIAAKPEEVTGLVITIDQVQVHRTSDSDAGWHTVSIEEGSFDLMELGTIEAVVAEAEITAGNYNQIRFGIDLALVTTASGEYEAEVPSGKLKINVPFVVHDDGTTEVTISIDPKASLKISGKKDNPKYKLHPVIHVEGVEED